MKFTGFQQLLYRKFLLERRWRVEEIAPQLGVGRSTLYAWIDGVMTFPVDLIPALFLVTQDPEWLHFCVQGTGYVLSRVPTAGEECSNVDVETFDVVAVVGRLAATVRRALADGRLTPEERRRIIALAREVQQEAEDITHAATRHQPY